MINIQILMSVFAPQNQYTVGSSLILSAMLLVYHQIVLMKVQEMVVLFLIGNSLR